MHAHPCLTPILVKMPIQILRNPFAQIPTVDTPNLMAFCAWSLSGKDFHHNHFNPTSQRQSYANTSPHRHQNQGHLLPKTNLSKFQTNFDRGLHILSICIWGLQQCLDHANLAGIYQDEGAKALKIFEGYGLFGILGFHVEPSFG